MTRVVRPFISALSVLLLCILSVSCSSLGSAARTGDLDVMEEHLQRGADINAVESFQGQSWTPLMFASHFRQTEAVQFLLERGAEVNFKSSDGSNALILAVTAGITNLVKLLLDYGADTSVETEQGKNVLMIAFDQDSNELTELLLGKMSPLVSERLLKKAFSYLVNPLYFASASVRPQEPGELDKMLLEAAYYGRLDEVRHLMDQGADPNSINHEGDQDTVLIKAVQSGNAEVVRYLIKKKIDLEAHSKSTGNTALIEAAYREKWEIVRLLVESGARANNHNESSSALTYAVEHNQFEMVQYLIHQGATVSGVIGSEGNAVGKLAVYLARKHQYSALLKYLESLGARDQHTVWPPDKIIHLNPMEMGDYHEVRGEYTQAIQWYEKVGTIDSYYRIARIHYRGPGEIVRNHPLAVQYFEKAADLGNADSAWEVYQYYKRSDRAKAAHYLRQAYEGGHHSAKFTMAQAYRDGHLVGRNIKKGVLLLHEAAADGEKNAMLELAKMYEWGIVVEKDLQKALYFYQQLHNDSAVKRLRLQTTHE